MDDSAPEKRLRTQQKRARDTRRRLIKAATAAFSTIGFDAATVADLEKEAKAQRGLLAYHFGSKEALWRAVLDELGEKLVETVRRVYWHHYESGDPLKAAVTALLHANAEVPEFVKILAQSRIPDRPYVAHILNNHLRPLLVGAEPVAGRPLSVFDYCILSGLTVYPIVWGGEARHIWGVEPRAEPFLSEYAEIVTALLRRHWQTNAEKDPGYR